MMLSPMGSMQSPGAGGAAFPPQPVLTETLPLHEQRTRTTSRAVQLAPGEPGCGTAHLPVPPLQVEETRAGVVRSGHAAAGAPP